MTYEAEYDERKQQILIWHVAPKRSRRLYGRGVIWRGTPSEAKEIMEAIKTALEKRKQKQSNRI